MHAQHEELRPRIGLAGVVAELEFDDPAAADPAAAAFREFLTPAPPTFSLRVHGRVAAGPAGAAAAEFVADDTALRMHGAAGRAWFDYRRGRGVLWRAHDLDAVRGLLTAIALRYLGERGGLILHAAGARTPAGALVFFGPSGSGKTTLAARLAAEEGVAILSDEAVAVRPAGAGWVAEGLPWRGRAIAAPLAALLALERAEALVVEPLAPAAFVRRVVSSVYVEGAGAWQRGRLFESVERLAQAVPAFRLRCPREGPVLRAVLGRLGAEPGAAR